MLTDTALRNLKPKSKPYKAFDRDGMADPMLNGLTPFSLATGGSSARGSLHASSYAALHAQTYGEAVDATTLIPHMLEAFMEGDRGFKCGNKNEKAAPA